MKGRSPSPSVSAGVADTSTLFAPVEDEEAVRGPLMLRILIAEDDPTTASTLQHLVEENPLYTVIGVAYDAPSAFALASAENPHVALLDLELARGSTGFAAAAQLKELGVICLFVSGKAPDIVMADLAIGCLSKPFTADDLHLALSIADDAVRGRSAGRTRLPVNLTLYDARSLPDRSYGTGEAVPAIQPSRYSFKRRLLYWMMALGSD
jgi:CheY-like chemotaxis protein